MCSIFIAHCSQTSIHGWHNYYLWNKFYKKIAPSDFHFQISLPTHTTKTPIDKWCLNVTQLKEFFTFSVKGRYQLNYNVFHLYQRLQWTDITSLKLNLFYFFIYCWQHHERKTTCLDIFLLSDRQWGTEHQYLLSRFLGVSILQLLIIYRIYDYDMLTLSQ